MTFSLLLATLLCFTTWMSSVHTITESECCLRWRNEKIRLEKIVNYTVQIQGHCPINAIKFHTKGNKTICSNPNTDWAKRAMMKVDDDTKALERGHNEDGSASGIMTPAMSISSKNSPRKNGRNGERRQRKKKGRKGQ